MAGNSLYPHLQLYCYSNICENQRDLRDNIFPLIPQIALIFLTIAVSSVSLETFSKHKIAAITKVNPGRLDEGAAYFPFSSLSSIMATSSSSRFNFERPEMSRSAAIS